jgi:energy-coupling factor transport system permease protein
MSESKKRLYISDYGCQFRVGDSPVHRLDAGIKLLIGTLLGAAAIAAHEPWSLGFVLMLNGLYYFSARLTISDLWQDTRYLLLQMFIIIGLYAIRYGVPNGLWPSLRVSLQIILFFIPGVVFLRTTQASQIMSGLRKIVPYRFSFLLFTSFRFIPFFAREMREIARAQRLRGARLAPRDLIDPRNWSDMFHCMVIPLLVRAMKTADEASLSARARGFGSRPERTYCDTMQIEKKQRTR